MANVEYLICSFCQGPSSRTLRQKLAPHLSDPQCRVRPSDLDWLDKWRLLLPSHVEWDLEYLRDYEFEYEYKNELPKTNVVSKVEWVPSIEGRISDTPEWEDLDGWRTIEFNPATSDGPTTNSQSERAKFDHSDTQPTKSVRPDTISKRTLHAYNDDIKATRLPFHSACLRILYETCNEVTYSTYATSTISDVVASILIPSWRDGDVSMDWVSRQRGEMNNPRLVSPWGEHWHPLDPATNFLAVDPSRPSQLHHVQSLLVQRPQRTPFTVSRSLPPLLRMPAEVLDLISDFLMEHHISPPRSFDSYLERKVQSLQNLRYTCRQLYHHSFPRIHFLSFLHAETRRGRCHDAYLRKPPYPPLLEPFEFQIHIPTHPRPYKRPLLPYRRIPALPPLSLTDRTIMETDWEAVYRSWKEGYGWRNRVRLFVCCETWLGLMQETIWEDREWGRTANYVVPDPAQDNVLILQPPPIVVALQQHQAILGGGIGIGNVVMATAALAEDEEMADEDGDLEQFQWP